MFKPLFDPAGLPILRPSDFSPRGFFNEPRARQLAIHPSDFLPKETEQASSYAAPIAGSAPNGLGFNFGDSFRRTGRGVMEFNLPTGQRSTINESLRYAAENVFVGKAMRLKTDFTCKGLRNSTADDRANTFFDGVLRKLNLLRNYRLGVWLYYTVGLVPILMNEPDSKLSFVQILDPRQVVVQEWYGKKYVYLKPDTRMLAALNDPRGTSSPFNRDYWEAMPKEWRKQLIAQAQKSGWNKDGLLIRLTDGSYTVIENRATTIERVEDCWDGAPLQPYFSSCQQYRQLMAGDFAAGFLAKNLLALVSVGDPKAEGDNYLRPDSTVLASMQVALQNPNYAQWLYGDPTFNVRYITPDVDTFSSSKYDEVRGHLQELLPNCFWSGEDGSFANSATSLMALQDEVDACNEAFDEYFFRVIYERAAQVNPRVTKSSAKPPLHDRNALRDKFAWLTAQSALYANGGLAIRTLLEEHGYDFESERQRLIDQQKDVKKGIFMPAFEAKQGIVVGVMEKAGVIEQTANEPQVPHLPLDKIPPGATVSVTTPADKPAASSKPTATKARSRSRSSRKKAGDGGKGGRPAKTTNKRPQPETNNARAPRPKTGGS